MCFCCWGRRVQGVGGERGRGEGGELEGGERAEFSCSTSKTVATRRHNKASQGGTSTRSSKEDGTYFGRLPFVQCINAYTAAKGQESFDAIGSKGYGKGVGVAGRAGTLVKGVKKASQKGPCECSLAAGAAAAVGSRVLCDGKQPLCFLLTKLWLHGVTCPPTLPPPPPARA